MRAKALVWKEGKSVIRARTPVGLFEIDSQIFRPYGASLDYGTAIRQLNNAQGGLRMESIEAAKAACQAEFDRIWREMTDTGEST